MVEHTWANRRLVGFDMETTGLDREHDQPVSYAFVEFDRGERREVEAGFVLPTRSIAAGAVGVHGLTRRRLAGLGATSLDEGIQRIASRLCQLSLAGIPVVGCNLTYDLTIVDRVLSRIELGASLRRGGWVGPALDVLVLDRAFDDDFASRPVRRLDALCAHYGLTGPDHSAPGDAEAAVRVLLAQASRFEELATTPLEMLQDRQAAWHATWSTERAEREQLRVLQPSLFVDEEVWPYDAGVAVTARG